MRKQEIIENEIYHVFGRGVNHAKIFNSELDYLRFYIMLFLFNNPDFSASESLPKTNNLLPFASILPKPKSSFIKIFSFCLLPNHYHLLVETNKETGLAQFMHRICLSHASYFNKKYGRSGPLFSGRFHAVHVKRDAHLKFLPLYIHLNALDLFDSKWRDGEVSNVKQAIEFLNSYKWSSHQTYKDQQQLLEIIDIKNAKDLFTFSDDYLDEIKQWITRFQYSFAEPKYPDPV